MYNRGFEAESYKYGFNGQEKDDEIKGGGNSLDFKARIYDPRLGKFLSIDPLTKKYPELSPYQFASNTPIQGIDIDGLEIYYTADGTLIGKYGDNTEIRVVNKDQIEAAKNITSNPSAIGSDVLNTKLYNSGSRGAFQTNNEVAEDWGKNNNPQAIKDNKEYSSKFFEITIDGKTYTTTTEVKQGGESTSTPDAPPEGKGKTGGIHSHGAYGVGYDNENWSPTDYQTAIRDCVDEYVVTPGGLLKQTNFGGKSEGVISTQMPSDPNSPDRQNTVAPEKVPVILDSSPQCEPQ